MATTVYETDHGERYRAYEIAVTPACMAAPAAALMIGQQVQKAWQHAGCAVVVRVVAPMPPHVQAATDRLMAKFGPGGPCHVPDEAVEE